MAADRLTRSRPAPNLPSLMRDPLRHATIARVFLIVASVTLLLPAGASLCLDGGDHVVLGWSAVEGACCDVESPRSGDACSPETCGTCEDVVVNADVALRADAYSLDGTAPLAHVAWRGAIAATAGAHARPVAYRMFSTLPVQRSTTSLRI